MKLSAQMTMGLAAVFAIAAFAVAITGFSSLVEITDAAQADDARGFAWFWTFLGAVAVLFMFVSWWMVRTHKEDA